MHLWCIVSWSWVQYIFGVASLVLCIVSYIAQACYRSGASTLFNIHSIFKAKLTGENTREVTYDILVSAISKKVVRSAEDSEPYMQIFVNLCMMNCKINGTVHIFSS